MKKTVVGISLLGIIFSWVFLSANKQGSTISQTLAEEKLVTFKQELVSFNTVVFGLNQGKTSVKTVKLRYRHLRNAYKQIEFLLEYTDPTLVKEYINGAPLPRLEKTAPSLLVLEPVGLQVIDELMAELPDSASAAQLLVQTETLKATMQVYQWQTKIYDRYIYEGAFVALIRLFSLGLTGFDTPGTLAGIEDAKSVLESLKSFLSLYQVALTAKKPELYAQIEKLINASIKALNEGKNFDEMNRFAFLIENLNPLIAKLNEAKLVLEIETMEEVNPGNNALNFEAKSLFDSNLLQKDFYLKLPPNYRNDKVKALGKLLFYDPILSANNMRSCASCHNPKLAFTDGLPKSRSIKKGEFIQRNSPSLINAVFAERYFHDLRASSLEDQTEHVIFSKEEFNTTYFDVFQKLNGSATYKKMFDAEFADFTSGSINRTTLSYALAAYVGSLTSFNSPFDKAVRSANSTMLTSNQIKGFNLFMGKAACGTCHFAPVFNGTTPPLFFDSESEVLGVPSDASQKVWTLDDDKGRAEGRFKEKVDFYEHSFKTSTVRNIVLSAPYMHNGSFKTIEAVMDFYNKGGGVGHGLVVPYQTLASDPLNLTKSEIESIIAFMYSLEDTSYAIEMPTALPKVELMPELDNRVVGGEY
jgi:cytochrome c peroxidase